MFDINAFEGMAKYDTFEFWFDRNPDDTWQVTSTKPDMNGNPIISGYVYDPHSDIIYDEAARDINDSDIANRVRYDFQEFQSTRPEYLVGEKVEVETLSQEEWITSYETLLVGIAFIRALRNGRNPDSTFSRISKCIEWLRKTDFYNAPASTIYHDAYPGGLLKHTLSVMNEIIELIRIPKFSSVRLEDAILVALVHDWCKIGLYEPYMKNVKNEETGQWEKVPAYKRKDAFIPLGHGASSMFLASNYFRLSIEESLAIRWHMGEYNVSHNEQNELHAANEKYPLVQLIQFADRLSITSY